MTRTLLRLLERDTPAAAGVACRRGAAHLARSRARAATRIAPDGLPLPPTKLIVLVAGTPEPEWFLESGALAARSIRGALGKAGVELERMGAILDFGCGCGRVLRQWAHLDGPEIWGTDYNERLVAWCRENLPFAQLRQQRARAAARLSRTSSSTSSTRLSVFTHLPERLQHAWIAELRRVVEPGGFVLFTAHGRRYLERLDEEERQRFLAGELVVRWERVAGTNLCAAYHPQSWVESGSRGTSSSSSSSRRARGGIRTRISTCCAVRRCRDVAPLVSVPGTGTWPSEPSVPRGDG